MTAPVIVGEAVDVHVDAVVQAISHRDEAIILDAASLARGHALVDGADLSVNRKGVASGRGWIRRIAPSGWRTGLSLNSHEWVAKAAWVSSLTSWLDVATVDWLSRFDALLSAESRHRQLEHAKALGFAVPRTLITNDQAAVAEHLGDRVIAKPIGPALFIDEADALRHVPASVVSVSEIEPDLFRGAPFVFQQFVDARRHVRVPVVAGRAWTCDLDADGLPADWREEDRAHQSFVRSADEAIGRMTVALCASLDVRTASADWVVDDVGTPWFLDLNPGGQWLFLPEPVAAEVTDSLADWLVGRDD